jgi:hypothetical protein
MSTNSNSVMYHNPPDSKITRKDMESKLPVR